MVGATIPSPIARHVCGGVSKPGLERGVEPLVRGGQLAASVSGRARYPAEAGVEHPLGPALGRGDLLELLCRRTFLQQGHIVGALAEDVAVRRPGLAFAARNSVASSAEGLLRDGLHQRPSAVATGPAAGFMRHGGRR